MITNRWVKCSDGNYWTNEDDYVTIVKVKIADLWYVYTEMSCPYGWNTLTKMEAYLINLKL